MTLGQKPCLCRVSDHEIPLPKLIYCKLSWKIKPDDFAILNNSTAVAPKYETGEIELGITTKVPSTSFCFCFSGRNFFSGADGSGILQKLQSSLLCPHIFSVISLSIYNLPFKNYAILYLLFHFFQCFLRVFYSHPFITNISRKA